MAYLFVDFETYYDNKDYTLKKMTPPEYILDRRFEMIFAGVFNPIWDQPEILEPDEFKEFLKAYPASSTTVISHNALFDHCILAWRYGYTPGRMLDTLGMSRALLNLPYYKLGVVARALGLGEKKDTIMRVSGMHAAEIKAAGLWDEFKNYCLRDVLQCAGIYMKLIPSFPLEERRIMDLVLRCAVEPKLYADTKLLKDHLFRLRQNKAQWLRETGQDRGELMSQDRFKDLLEELGVEVQYKESPTKRMIPCFAKTDQFMADLLEYNDADDDTNFKVQTLAAARLAHKSTIEETRAEKFLNVASLPWGNGAKLPVALKYGGAHTHRLSGEWGMNLQNLPRDKSKSRLRHALLAPPGHKVVTADLSQIEARITALFCRQEDLLEQFRDGEDVYANFATRVFGHQVNKTDHPVQRFIGKTGILGLSYGCGVTKFYRMVLTQARQAGIVLDKFDEEFAQNIVGIYRQTYRKIPAMWRQLDWVLQSVLLNQNVTQHMEMDPVEFTTGKISLPNGMALRYNTDDAGHLYGAKILENLIQALARVVVMQAAVRLDALGYRFVLQSHDELVFLIPDAEVEAAKAIIQHEMIQPPRWMPDLPLAVEIGVGKSYGEAK